MNWCSVWSIMKIIRENTFEQNSKKPRIKIQSWVSVIRLSNNWALFFWFKNIRICVGGQNRFEPGYVWKWKFLYPERKSCWFKNFPMRVVGALVLLVIIYLFIFFILFFRLQRRIKRLKTTAAMGRQNSKYLNNMSLGRKFRPDISRVYSNFPFALTCYTYLFTNVH